MKHVVRAI